MRPSNGSAWGLLFLRLFAEASLSGLGCQLQESILYSRCESSHGLAADVFSVAGKSLGIPLTVAVDGEDFFFDSTTHVVGT